MNKLPQSIIVSSNEYEIRPVKKIDDEDVGECKGLTHDDKKLIEVVKGMNDVEKSVILMHEIIHAICNEYDIHIGGKNEEEIASRLAPAMHNVFVDNPDYMEYFSKVIKTSRESKINKLLRK